MNVPFLKLFLGNITGAGQSEITPNLPRCQRSGNVTARKRAYNWDTVDSQTTRFVLSQSRVRHLQERTTIFKRYTTGSMSTKRRPVSQSRCILTALQVGS
jgi:hypothetical protein